MSGSKKSQQLKDARLANVPYLEARAARRLPLFDGAIRVPCEEGHHRSLKRTYHFWLDNPSTSTIENQGANDIALRAWEDGEE